MLGENKTKCNNRFHINLNINYLQIYALLYLETQYNL